MPTEPPATPTRSTPTTVLLAVIAAAVVAIAAVLIYTTFLRGDGSDPALAEARDSFRSSAEIYCTLGGQPGATEGLYSEEYERCVDARVDSVVEQWESADRPDLSTFTPY